MFMVGLISWWYGRGWVGQLRRVVLRFSATLDFFSIGQLLSTLFSPFRQISASSAGNGSFGSVFRSFVDQLISRIIGGFVRFFTILFGLLVITLQALYELTIMVSWWFLPLLPIAGCILFATGWTP